MPVEPDGEGAEVEGVETMRFFVRGADESSWTIGWMGESVIIIIIEFEAVEVWRGCGDAAGGVVRKEVVGFGEHEVEEGMDVMTESICIGSCLLFNSVVVVVVVVVTVVVVWVTIFDVDAVAEEEEEEEDDEEAEGISNSFGRCLGVAWIEVINFAWRT
jgi:hypothetical protein